VAPVIEAPTVTLDLAPERVALADLPSLPGPPVTLGAFGEAAVSAPVPTPGRQRASGFGGVAAAGPATETRTIAEGAFGDTRQAERPNPASRPVSPGTFGDTETARREPVSRPKAAAIAASSVEILSKPQPNYTEEARRRRIEGEVLLEVLFRASGEVQVLKVIRGLGHGLDESAAAAARRIRFRPARRDGVPADSTAVVRIVFQLAF
jgi:TonB family protein